MKPSLLFILGPTASGKSELALNLAEHLQAEIISADSMLVYRGMDIGTAKPSREDRLRIPHHFIDTVNPGEDYSVFEYRREVLELLKREAGVRKTFVIVGGSGLYVKALLHGISEKPGANPDIRKLLLRESHEKGFEILRDRLKTIDPDYAKIARDERRVLRALEVYELSGKTMTQWDRETHGLLDPSPGHFSPRIRLYGLSWKREILHRRIAERVYHMIAEGLLEEVRRLNQSHWSRTAKQAIGYAETLRYFGGEITEEEIAPLIIKNTIALGKRQMTWFRREQGIEWFDLEQPSDLDDARQKIAGDFILTPDPSPYHLASGKKDA